MGRRKRERRQAVTSGKALPHAVEQDFFWCGSCGRKVLRLELRRGGPARLKQGRVFCAECWDVEVAPLAWKLAVHCESPRCQRPAEVVCNLAAHAHLFCSDCHRLVHVITAMNYGGDAGIGIALCTTNGEIPVCEQCGMIADLKCPCDSGHEYHLYCWPCHEEWYE